MATAPALDNGGPKAHSTRVPFASQSMHTNNVNLGLDFGASGFVPTRVQFEFLDQGGSENLSVNGSVRCSVGRKLRRPKPPRLAGRWSCYGRREHAPGAAVGRNWPGPS